MMEGTAFQSNPRSPFKCKAIPVSCTIPFLSPSPKAYLARQVLEGAPDVNPQLSCSIQCLLFTYIQNAREAVSFIWIEATVSGAKINFCPS